MSNQGPNAGDDFRVEEATIAQLHEAILAGKTSCLAVVDQYLARVQAFNGPSSLLVTQDGKALASGQATTGTLRGMQTLQFPTQTVAAASLLPDLEHYRGTPLEFGRMEGTASDPSAVQQFGMIVGKPAAGQLNALSTLNIRGERSVTCRGDFDRHPALGPLPAGAPPVCENFRQHPDAREQAAALDAKFGRHPDLKTMPLYGVVFSFKDAFDTCDMRSTGGADAFCRRAR